MGPDNTVVIIEWSIIEPNLGIICACIPVIHRPVANLVVHIWRDELKRKSSAKYVQPSAEGSNTAPVDNNPWFPLEPYDASRPKRMTSVLSRPPAHKGDEESMGSSTYITKTTDISVRYDS
ncbi:hypothetical protein MMC07_002558 [Pseudocyphellaria aurata]|nr:hypothetical protein [Pseudocyphellaria aurata]